MATQTRTSSLTHFEINDIALESKIGSGQFSVYKATMWGKKMAVKKMDCDKNQIPHEVEVYSILSPHPNILPLLGISHSDDGFTAYICMELASKSLHQYLHTEKRTPPPQQSVIWAVQTARGMQHIHQHGLAHRDLKSANILLMEKEGLVKLCDFGSARVLENTKTVTGMTGTYRWMAPEFNDTADTKVNQRCDVFSYGMVLYELFAGDIPFSGIDDDVKVATSIRNGKRPSVPSEVQQHIKKLLQSCWKSKPHDRPTFDGVLRAIDLGPQLHKAAERGNPSAVQRLFKDGVDVNSRTENGETALHRAAKCGHNSVLQLLVRANADLNLRDENGHTALYDASFKGHVDIVQLLLQKRANVSIRDKDGLSPLYVASEQGYTDIVDILLQNGANPNQAGMNMRSVPLEVAAGNGHKETVERLLKERVNINYQNKSGETALYAASQGGHVEVVQLLLQSEADASIRNKDGRTARDTARAKRHIAVADLLKQYSLTH